MFRLEKLVCIHKNFRRHYSILFKMIQEQIPHSIPNLHKKLTGFSKTFIRFINAS